MEKTKYIITFPVTAAAMKDQELTARVTQTATVVLMVPVTQAGVRTQDPEPRTRSTRRLVGAMGTLDPSTLTRDHSEVVTITTMTIRVTMATGDSLSIHRTINKMTSSKMPMLMDRAKTTEVRQTELRQREDRQKELRQKELHQKEIQTEIPQTQVRNPDLYTGRG